MKSLYLLTVLAVLAFATQADAQGPLRRLLFGNRFAAPSCANGQCEVMPAPAVAPVQPKAACLCGKAECPLCCPDGKCCEVPGVVGAKAPSDAMIEVPYEDMDAIIKKLEAKPDWKKSSVILRSQLNEWKGKKTVLANADAFEVFEKEAGVAAVPMRALDAKSFAGALQTKLVAQPKRGIAERHYLRILNGPDSPRRDRQIARMERLVRAELNVGPTAAIDWQSIDWAAILRFLLTILPLFL